MVVEMSEIDFISVELKNRMKNKERKRFLKKKSVCVLGQSYSLHGLYEMVVFHISIYNQRKYPHSTHQNLRTLRLPIFQRT